MPKLSKKFIDSLESKTKSYIVWDDNPRGLGLKVTRAGSKSFILKYRNIEGRQRKLKIDVYGVITLEEARKRAKTMLAEVSKGNDPANEKREAKTTLTMKDLFERYLEEHSKVRNKTSTFKNNRDFIRRHLLPELGSYTVKSISRKDIFALQQKLSKEKTKPIANNAISILSKAFNLAEVWGLRSDYTNPCRHVQKFPMKSNQRFLSKEEFTKLGDVLNFMEKTQLELPSVISAIRLLMHTGCRHSEILGLKWSYIDFENKCFRLPDSKTGAKTVYFSDFVFEYLKNMNRKLNNDYVIAGEVEGQPLINLQKPWNRIRKKAGLADVRIHDLRHSFASMAAASGMSLPIIGAMLGHSQPKTTAQYVHLIGAPMREATNIVSNNINEIMRK
jgi:integrase